MRRLRTVWLPVLVFLGSIVPLTIAGYAAIADEPRAITEARETCGGTDCHAEAVEAYAAGPHAEQGCVTCHEGAEEHVADPENVTAVIDWRVDSCADAECHETIASTYLYDDNLKVGPFGGSQREPAIHKTEEFPEYNTIIAGHPFTRDYREEGAHLYILEEHYETLRGKFDTCLQCKSTKVVWAWERGRPLTVDKDQVITLKHTATDEKPARTVDVPAGTVIQLGTDFESFEVSSSVTFPDGRVYISRPGPDEDFAEHHNMLWAATMAATKDLLPYGTGCNHCHDPHSGQLRAMRPAMNKAIESGGPKGQGGVNPYDPEAGTDFDNARVQDREILVCAQCHVEYSCARSAIDRKVRDHFGWSKAGDLHDYYMRQFGYQQDWANAIIGKPLIKSQHPEVELLWNSVHYATGASCASCHMPFVRTGTGEWVRSHWMTSPYKYHEPEVFSAFAEATGLRSTIDRGPCAVCHADRIYQGIAGQVKVYERQKVVEQLLARSVATLGAVREAVDAGLKVDTAAHNAAVEQHQRAHVLWEYLIVSENSMGFHNFAEVLAAMDDAEKHAREAIRRAEMAYPAGR